MRPVERSSIQTSLETRYCDRSLGDAVVDRVALTALEQLGVQVRSNMQLNTLQHDAQGKLQQARFTPIAPSQAAPPPPPQRRFSDADAAAHPLKRRSSELNIEPPVPTGEEVLECSLLVGCASLDVQGEPAPDFNLAQVGVDSHTRQFRVLESLHVELPRTVFHTTME